MAVIPKHQINTTEEKFDKVIEILSGMYNKIDADFVKSFVFEICTRYIDKVEEVKPFLSSSLQSMNEFEVEYMKRVIKDLKL